MSGSRPLSGAVADVSSVRRSVSPHWRSVIPEESRGADVPITTAALAITGARLIDGTGAAPVADAVIQVDERGELIFAGPAALAPRQDPGVPVIDVAGRTVLP